MYEYVYKEPETYYDETLLALAANTTTEVPVNKYISYWQHDDASWIFSDVFMVLSIQTGFALLESGCASLKNEANIMMKNAIDVLMGGFSFWLVGYGLSFGEGSIRRVDTMTESAQPHIIFQCFDVTRYTRIM